MYLNRAKSIVSVSKTAVNCLVNKCNKNFGLRAFASSSSSLKNSSANANSTSSVTSQLLRNLKSEYEAQKEMIKEQGEELEPKKVLEHFSSFLKENNWTLEHAEDSTLVTLKRRDESLQADVLLKFDLVEVFNELYEDNIEEEFDSEESVEESESNEVESSVDEEMQFVTLPFSLEIKRDSIPEKTLLFECVLEGDESENGIIIENVAVMPTEASNVNTAYTAPSYSQLDETLQENFEEFVDNLVASEELLGFVKNYSVASEAGLYQKWLKDVRSILKN